MLQPDYMGLLNHLSSEELKEMLNDDTNVDTVLKDFNQVKEWEKEKEMIMVSNRSLAEYNLSKEPELAGLKQAVQDKSALGDQLCSAIQDLLNQYKTKSAGISADTTLALLQTAAAETEEISEDIAQQFLLGKIDVDKFLEDFTPVRETMHLRKFKVEKMQELLLGTNSSNNGRPTLPYPAYCNQSVPNIPYPVGPLNMPMPGMYGNHF